MGSISRIGRAGSIGHLVGERQPEGAAADGRGKQAGDGLGVVRETIIQAHRQSLCRCIFLFNILLFNNYLLYLQYKIITWMRKSYIYFIDKSWRDRLTVPEIPFSRIDEMGAGGEKIQQAERHAIKTEKQCPSSTPTWYAAAPNGCGKTA